MIQSYLWSHRRRDDDSFRGRWRNLPRLVKLLWEVGPRELATIAGFSVLSGLVPLGALLILRGLIDSAAGTIAGTESMTVTLLWLGALLVTILADSVTAKVHLWLADDLQERLKQGAHERLLAKAGRIPLAMFDNPEFFDQLHRSQHGLDNVLFTSMRSIFQLPARLITVVGLLIFLGTAHFLLPLVLIAGMIPLHISESRITKRIIALKRKHSTSERYVAYLDDMIMSREAAAEIRLFGTGPYLRERRMDHNMWMKKDRLQLALERTKTALFGNLWEQLTYGIVITGVVALIALGRLSIGYFAAYLTAVERFTGAFSGVLNGFRSTDKTLRTVWDMFEYLDLPEERALLEPRTVVTKTDPQVSGAPGKDKTSGSLTPDPDGRLLVEFDDVVFIYPGSDRPVLDGLSFTLEPGKTVALVGENGAGKTTLSKLLLALYRPTKGRILVNGIDLAEIDPYEWRRHAAAVFQDYMRYELTARENVGYGDLTRLDDLSAIQYAAARSGAHDLVESLPMKYETVLGKAWDDDGQDLSTGQWQKLVIARAYLQKASVLILDEPTSALDARTEVEVYRQFRDMSEGKSVLLISHRLGSARLADRVAFLENGQLVEEGNHDDLVEQKGRYARMYSVQAGWYR